MSAYQSGSDAAVTQLGLTKEANLARAAAWLIPKLLPAGVNAAEAAIGTGMRGVGQALLKRFGANKFNMALGAGFGLMGGGNGAERGSNAAIQSVAGAFGMPGMLAGSLLGPTVSNKLFGDKMPPMTPEYAQYADPYAGYPRGYR